MRDQDRRAGSRGREDPLEDLRLASDVELGRRLVRRYQPFTEPADSPLGTGPPVAAGVATQEEWDTIATTLLRDPGSIVPALLREFPR